MQQHGFARLARRVRGARRVKAGGVVEEEEQKLELCGAGLGEAERAEEAEGGETCGCGGARGEFRKGKKWREREKGAHLDSE